MGKFRTRSFLALLLITLSQTVYGAYVFTAPPRESIEAGTRIYQPIAEYLSKSTGQKFIYKQQTSWKDYVKDMRKQKFDLVFDGPHFVDWRIQNIMHHTIVKIPHLLRWRVITRKENQPITSLDQLSGKTACAPGIPNFGTLNLFNHFKNTEKPIHVEVNGWNNVYEAVRNGECVAGVLPKKNHEMYDPENLYTVSIHTHLPYPNQAMTAGKRIPEALKEKIRQALLSEEGQQALKHLRARYTGGSRLVFAEDEEYDSIHMVLLQEKGFTTHSRHQADASTHLVRRN